MPLLSVIGVGTDAVYTVDDDLQGLQQVVLADQPAGPKKFSYSDNGFVVTVQGSPGVAALYDNMSTKVAEYFFENLYSPAVCISSAGEWFFVASADGNISLYGVTRDRAPYIITSLSPGYTALAFNIRSGYLACFSTMRAEAVEVCPKTGTKLPLKNAHKLKYGTGAVSDGQGRIAYYTPDNVLKRCIITGDGEIEVTGETPVWEGVGSEEYVPAADPAVSAAGEIFCIGTAGGSLLKFNSDLDPEAYTAVAGLQTVSYPEFLYIPDGLVLPASVDCGTVQIPFCAAPVSFTVEASSKVRSLLLTAPEGCFLSLDGIGWQSELYIATLTAGSNLIIQLHVNTVAPGRVVSGITIETSVVCSGRTLQVVWTGRVPDMLVIPVRAFSAVPAVIDAEIDVKRIRPSLIIKKIPVTVSFEE